MTTVSDIDCESKEESDDLYWIAVYVYVIV